MRDALLDVERACEAAVAALIAVDGDTTLADVHAAQVELIHLLRAAKVAAHLGANCQASAIIRGD